MPNKISYDYIIAGMGCAGLSLAMQLKESTIPFEKILLIDKDLKQDNDRTWCFWNKGSSHWFDPIVFKKWNTFSFTSVNFHKKLSLQPYTYQLIRGIDFYNYSLSELKKDERFHIVTATILELGSVNGYGFLRTTENNFSAPYVFNSAFRSKQVKKNDVDYIQHFKGFLIETEKESFDVDCPVFMNFDTEQFNDCRFFYVIPFSKNKALIEYTGFSKNSLSDEEYEQALKHHIEKELHIQNYTILETEKGSIPMSTAVFHNPYGDAVINIGTAGGYSKPSTGYTFYFIQKNIQDLVLQLTKKNKPISAPVRKARYTWYDKILLDVLNKKQPLGRDVFTILFKKNSPAVLLAFLNEESSFVEDLKIINSVPKLPFLISAVKKMFH